MDIPDKIVSEVGEKRPRRIQAPNLRPYLWNKHLTRALCRACTEGSLVILARTWAWVRAAAPGDRWIRALAPAGTLVGSIYALRAEPRAAAVGIVAAWAVAAAALAPREAWTGRPGPTEEEPPMPAGPTGAELLERDRRALLRLLDEATVRRNGIHLAELYELTSQHPLFGAVPRAQLGALLAGLGVPVTRALSVDGVSGRTGVRRADVASLLLLPSPSPGDADSRDTESTPDQHESQPLSDGSRSPLGTALGPP
jgi:hypothetical protein